MSCLDYKNTVRAISASITFACTSAIQKWLLPSHPQKHSGMSVLRNTSAEFPSCTHLLNLCIPPRAHLKGQCCAIKRSDKQLLGELVSASPATSLPWAAAHVLLRLPSTPAASINSSLCISLLVYLLEVKNTFTTSPSMKHSLRELPY